MKTMVPLFHTVKTIITAIPNGEQIWKESSNSSTVYGTYIRSVGKPIYFATLLFLKHRFCAY